MKHYLRAFSFSKGASWSSAVGLSSNHIPMRTEDPASHGYFCFTMVNSHLRARSWNSGGMRSARF